MCSQSSTSNAMSFTPSPCFTRWSPISAASRRVQAVAARAPIPPRPSGLQSHPAPTHALINWVTPPPAVMPLTFVPGVESRTENKHDLKSGQRGGNGGRERVRRLPSIFPAYSLAPLEGHKAPPSRIPGACVPAPCCLRSLLVLRAGVFPCGSLVLGPQSEPIELQGSHGSETIQSLLSDILGF